MAKNLKDDKLENVSGGYNIVEKRRVKQYKDPGTNASAHKYVNEFTVSGHQNGNQITKTFSNRAAAVKWADNNLD